MPKRDEERSKGEKSDLRYCDALRLWFTKTEWSKRGIKCITHSHHGKPYIQREVTRYVQEDINKLFHPAKQPEEKDKTVVPIVESKPNIQPQVTANKQSKCPLGKDDTSACPRCIHGVSITEQGSMLRFNTVWLCKYPELTNANVLPTKRWKCSYCHKFEVRYNVNLNNFVCWECVHIYPFGEMRNLEEV